MKTYPIALVVATLTSSFAWGHATFQELWVEGVDEKGTCARLPVSNSPVTSVTSNDIRCNAKPSPAEGNCNVAAGDTITVEMHQQPDNRDCSAEALGGNHHGPVMAYLSKVSDATTADGSSEWFKIYENGYDASSKIWGNDILNKNCGKQDVKIPADIAPGDYLLRAETIALHAASSAGGAQFYMTCYQIAVTGGGSANPAGVNFPGAYSASDPGIEIDIYKNLSSYTIPGPPVYSA